MLNGLATGGSWLKDGELRALRAERPQVQVQGCSLRLEVKERTRDCIYAERVEMVQVQEEWRSDAFLPAE